MRDPARIDKVLAALRAAWVLQPDTRLTQLVYNAARPRSARQTMGSARGGWVTSGKSQAHYIRRVRVGPALCGAMPNNGLWRRHAGLTNRFCNRCRRLSDEDETGIGAGLSSTTVSGPVARIVLALRRLINAIHSTLRTSSPNRY